MRDEGACPGPFQFKRFTQKTFVIGVAGGTASGKTTVCDLIIQRLHDQCCVMISQDSFYKVLTPHEIQSAARGEYNFDSPQAFDEALMLECIDTLVSGQPFDLPIYNFATHSREKRVRRVDPADLVIIEGILVLHMQSVLERCQMKVFVDTDDDVRLARRIQRDVTKRGRSITGVIQQYTQHVKPSFDEYIGPSRRLADVIIPWQRGDNLVAIDLIVEHLKSQLQRHSLHDAYPNLHVVPSNFQVRGMHTVIRNVDSNKNDFIFMADRLIRLVHGMHTVIRNLDSNKNNDVFMGDRLICLVVEYGLGLLPFEERTVITPTGTPYKGTGSYGKLCGVSVIRSGESMESALRSCCKGIDIGKILVHRVANWDRDVIYEKLPSDIADRYVLLMDPILGTGRTACRALRVLREKGVLEERIIYLTIIASPKGIDYVCRNYPNVKVITTEIDKDIDQNMRVVPGIGEFGDRYFCA